MSSLKRYGTTALVTGASSGIGKSYARAIAKDGLNLVLVARRKALLDELAEELSGEHGIQVHTIAQDLTDMDAADKVHERFCRKVGGLSEPIYTRLLRIPIIGR